MKNAKNTAQGILCIACPIAFLILLNTYFIEHHFILDYFLILIISTIGSLITRDMEDGMLAGFYGSSLALIIWLCIPLILSYILPIFTSIFTISDLILNIIFILIRFGLELLLIIILYRQKLHLLLYALIILFLVGYLFPLVISISVEFGYMINWKGVIQIIFDFLLNVIGVIIISTFSGLIGGWIGMKLLKKNQVEKLDDLKTL